MKALTVIQPWASAIVLGHKEIETRSWTTRYRGDIAIHAAKLFPTYAREFAETERVLGRIPERLPLGAVIAVARLVDIRPTEELAGEISGLERLYGDYTPARFGWILAYIEPLAEPIPAKGSLGLWNWDMP